MAWKTEPTSVLGSKLTLADGDIKRSLSRMFCVFYLAARIFFGVLFSNWKDSHPHQSGNLGERGRVRCLVGKEGSVYRLSGPHRLQFARPIAAIWVRMMTRFRRRNDILDMP